MIDPVIEFLVFSNALDELCTRIERSRTDFFRCFHAPMKTEDPTPAELLKINCAILRVFGWTVTEPTEADEGVLAVKPREGGGGIVLTDVDPATDPSWLDSFRLWFKEKGRRLRVTCYESGELVHDPVFAESGSFQASGSDWNIAICRLILQIEGVTL